MSVQYPPVDEGRSWTRASAGNVCQHEGEAGSPCDFCRELELHYIEIAAAAKQLELLIDELGPSGLAERPAWMPTIERRSNQAGDIAQWADDSAHWAGQSAAGLPGWMR